ncbi:MAG: MCE family protein [Elusimicrobia bacterium]|nr:MCE family protein [Elusimicrobiota bacterium]
MINAQTKVGMLILAAMIVAMAVVVNLGNIPLKRGYQFYIMFDDLADLPTRPMVKISGVEVGRVNKVELQGSRARIRVWIQQDVRLYKNLRAKILKMGMIGNTYVSLTRGTEDFPQVRSGDTIEGENPLSYEEVIDSFVSGLQKLVKAFDDLGGNKDLGENISMTFANLRDLSGALNTALGKDGYKLSRAVDNINSVLNNLNLVMEDEIKAIGGSIEKLGSAADELRIILSEVHEGKGPLGKIVSSEEYGKKVGQTIDSIYSASQDLRDAVNRLKGFDTSVGAQVYYEPGSEQYRSYMGMTFRTASKRYLSLGLDNIRAGESSGSDPDEGGDRMNAVSLLAGKSFGSFTVFGGAIRSSGGFGAGWMFKNRLELGTRMFEFSRDNPWWTVSSKLKLTEFLNLGVAYENILDDGEVRAGVEVDIK